MVVDQQSWSSEALPLVGATIRVEEEKQQEDGMRSNGNVVQEAEEEEQDVSIMTNPVFALQRSTSIPRDIPAPLTGTRKEGAATSAGTQARNTESGRVGTAHEGVATIQDHVRAGDSQVATAKINKTAIWILIAYALFAAGYMCRELQLGILNTATLTKEDVLRISQKQIDETLRQATVSGRTEEDILSIFNQRFQETLQKATVSELTEEDVLRISQKQIDEVLSQATVSGLTEEDVVSIFNQQIKETLQEVKSPGSINEDIIQVVKQQVQLALEEANGFGTTCNDARATRHDSKGLVAACLCCFGRIPV
ncbi:expressed unknown protein [Seminavis robusta]|uniref:Uncharacterized protein n=1 Tax=Seminavis robusta TaxID=568900 RepID=A0A9N8DGI4_9STRA|nr:expressed unknown protein [Seminavis robusta]|eukprot:Sro81_g043370.1 n/a (310) ;mRNA; r:23314-24299